MKKLKIYCSDPNCKPERQHATDAGLDLRSCDNVYLHDNIVTMVYTGIHVEIPPGYVGLVFPRSSIGKRGVRLANTVGVIDSDYRGEIICLMQHSDAFYIQKYERVAQLVLVPCALPTTEIVENLNELSETKRGDGGFGHTGKH